MNRSKTPPRRSPDCVNWYQSRRRSKTFDQRWNEIERQLQCISHLLDFLLSCTESLDETEDSSDIPEGNLEEELCEENTSDIPEGDLEEELFEEDSSIDWNSPPLYDVYPDDDDVKVRSFLHSQEILEEGGARQVFAGFSMTNSFDFEVESMVGEFNIPLVFDEISKSGAIVDFLMQDKYFDISSSGIIVDHDLLYSHASKELTFDHIWEEFMTREINQIARLELIMFMEQTDVILINEDVDLCYESCLREQLKKNKSRVHIRSARFIESERMLMCGEINALWRRRKKGWKALLWNPIDRGKSISNSRTSFFQPG